MDIHYKIYLNPENPGLGSYFSYGGILRSHTIDYPAHDWLDYEEEGLTYYEYRQFSTTQHIWKTGPNLLLVTVGCLSGV